jgi:chemotaxis protein MotB
MARSRRDVRQVDIWPGFVDALSTLLLSVIFLLVVFVLGQFFLSQVLQGRTETLDHLRATVHDLTQKLGLEQDNAADLQRNVQRLSSQLQSVVADREDVGAQLKQTEADRAALEDQLTQASSARVNLQRTLDEMRIDQGTAQAQIGSLQKDLAEARQTMGADKDKLTVQLGQLVQLRRDIDSLTKVRDDLEGQVAGLSASVQQSKQQQQQLLAQLGTTRDQGKALEAQLADQQQKTMLAQKDVDARDLRIEELLRSAATLESAKEGALSDKAAAMQEVRQLDQRLQQLSIQLTQLDSALGQKQSEIDRQNATISDLGQRLNVALANKVEELSRYRSDFFGKLRQVLGSRDDIRVVGDRFVFQSEVLFGSGEADINPSGRDKLAELATTLKEIAKEIPPDLPWVLQVDGHTDRRPISNAQFSSNWELSTARAISVVKFLISEGIPPDRLAARGFGEFQPLDTAENDDAYRRNRRIELKLTTR